MLRLDATAACGCGRDAMRLKTCFAFFIDNLVCLPHFIDILTKLGQAADQAI